jgi:hypothetical protein
MPPEAWPQSSYEQLEQAAPERPALRGHRMRVAWAGRPAAAALAACLLLAAGVVIGIAIERGSGSQDRPSILLRPLQGSTSDSATAQASAGRLKLNVARLPRLGAGRYYELWLMSSKTSLVALASFRVARNGTAALEVPLPVSPGRFRYLDISVQSITGGAGHSNESVLRGPSPNTGGPS